MSRRRRCLTSVISYCSLYRCVTVHHTWQHFTHDIDSVHVKADRHRWREFLSLSAGSFRDHFWRLKCVIYLLWSCNWTVLIGKNSWLQTIQSQSLPMESKDAKETDADYRLMRNIYEIYCKRLRNCTAIRGGNTAATRDFARMLGSAFIGGYRYSFKLTTKEFLFHHWNGRE